MRSSFGSVLVDITPVLRQRPHRCALAALVLAGLVVYTVTSWPISQPGTMDSHYYYGGGRSLLEFRAFVEPYIWNYLDDPAPLPTPSHLYWMPLSSMLVALAQAVMGKTFAAAKTPFILLAVVLPLVSYSTSWRLTQNKRHATIAALLTIFSGFYFPYWTIPETFAPFAVTGSLSLYALGRWQEERGNGWLLGVGLLSGLGHLCRADGVLLLGIGLLLVVLSMSRRPKELARSLATLLAGYLLVLVPWMARNWLVIGRPLPTSGLATIFLKSYDELFSYGVMPSLTSYLTWGWKNILSSKLSAGWTSLQTFAAVNNLIFLTPFTLVGLWQTRRRSFLRPAFAYGIGLYGVMTLLFTYPGIRGGLFHSSAALLPTVFALSMVGLDTSVAWVARRRRQWDQQQARWFFSLGIVALAIGLSAFVYTRGVIGTGTYVAPSWNRTDHAMAQVGRWIEEQDKDSPVVMVGNPPAFTYHSNLWSIVVPNEGIDETLNAARRYGAKYIVLDHNRPNPLAAVYSGVETHPALVVIWDEGLGAPPGIVVFKICADLICQSDPNTVH